MNKLPKHDPSCMDDFDPNSLSIEQAREQIQNDIEPVKLRERLPIRTALHRVLAKAVKSKIDVPAYDNSAMDGYAIAGADLPSNHAKNFTLIGTAFAGIPFAGVCQAGETVRIMTGAVIPEGCDTVIMQEHVERLSETTILIGHEHKTGQNVRYAGEDIKTGGIALEPGKRITPADLGVIASLGVGEVSVYQRPRVAFFSTGDELRSVEEPLEKGQIYDSNRYTLYGVLKRLDVELIDMGVIPDDPQLIREALEAASSSADAIITSGGVSVGEADYIKDILEEIGDVGFWKIAMKPGRPLTYGRVNKARFFGLPGNPVSAMVTFYQFVHPALQKMANANITKPLTLNAQCQSTLRKRPGRFEYQRGIYQQDEKGKLTVTATGQQGSGILSSMSQANCFILLPLDSSGVSAGDIVDIQPFDGLI